MEAPADVQLPLLVGQQHGNYNGRHDPGDQCWNCYSFRSPMESIYQKRISSNINQIHNDRDLHGHLRVTHGTEYRRSGIV